MSSKTKRVDGVDLSERCFAFIGNPQDTSTWKLPIHFPGDQKKTVSHIKDALGRFQQTQGIPDEDFESVRCIIVGAARSHGIKVQDSFRRVTPPAARVEPSPAELAMQRELDALKKDFAVADFRADAFLQALGIE
jgi:hypothetical protein